MNIFVDSSALLAVLDAGDAHHPAARATWERILKAGDLLVCHNCILVETSALVLRRLGTGALRVFERDIVPVLKIVWVDRNIHNAAASALLVADRRFLSLVDCVSFEIMRHSGIQTAFAFDRHFQQFGYGSI
jgi:predicted nucleic acid-binding protein